MSPKIAVVIILVIVLIGIIFYRKRNETENKNVNDDKVLKKYSVFITDSFTKEDAKYMRPMFTLTYTEKGSKQEAVLCKDLDNAGELTLDDAKDLMVSNIDYAFKKNIYNNSKVHQEGIITEEERICVDSINRKIFHYIKNA